MALFFSPSEGASHDYPQFPGVILRKCLKPGVVRLLGSKKASVWHDATGIVELCNTNRGRPDEP